MSKKQRISRLTSQVQPSFTGLLPASIEKATAAPPPPPALASAATPSALLLPPTRLPTSNPPHTTSTNSPSTPEGRGTQDLPVDSFSQNSSSIHEDQQQKYTSQTPLGIAAPAAKRVEPPRLASKKHTALHQKPKMVTECKQKGESKMQHKTSGSEEEKDLRKEETAKLKQSSRLDSGEAISALLFITTVWVTLVKKTGTGNTNGLFFHLLYMKCLAIIPAVWS